MPEYSILDLRNLVKSTPVEPKPADASRGYGALDADEIEAIHERLLEVAENEEVFSILWENREAIYDAVRLLKAKYPGRRFRGVRARGEDLDLMIVMPSDIKRGGTVLSTFVTDVSSAGEAYFESDTDNNKLTLPKDEARVYCGWVDPVDNPLASKVAIELPDEIIVIRLPFEFKKDYPVVGHNAVVVKPETSYRIRAYYSGTGTDQLTPIAVRITTAVNLRQEFSF